MIPATSCIFRYLDPTRVGEFLAALGEMLQRNPSCSKLLPPQFAGFTLLEVAMVMVLVGVVTLIAMPRIQVVLARRDLMGAREGVHGLLRRARTAAIQARRPVTIEVSPAAVAATIVRRDGSRDRVATLPVESLFGVIAESSADSLVIQPTGLVTSGTPFTVWLRKAARSDSVRVTGYGRLE